MSILGQSSHLIFCCPFNLACSSFSFNVFSYPASHAAHACLLFFASSLASRVLARRGCVVAGGGEGAVVPGVAAAAAAGVDAAPGVAAAEGVADTAVVAALPGLCGGRGGVATDLQRASVCPRALVASDLVPIRVRVFCCALLARLLTPVLKSKIGDVNK